MLGKFSFEPLFHETGIPLAIMGMLVVFVALSILIAIISAMPRVIEILENKASKKKAKSQSSRNPASSEKALAIAPSPSEPEFQSDLPLELIAVIAAAAEFELGPVRVVRMRPLTPSELAWTLEGRLRHHASHRLQPRNR
ncbi:OadG family protein [Novipirellula sp. SH528]|uniref:OadG family protein n=1 Tax=Novipirellula sp. SH528 TaxID=3454466 RepID=UPI003FA14825